MSNQEDTALGRPVGAGDGCGTVVVEPGAMRREIERLRARLEAEHQKLRVHRKIHLEVEDKLGAAIAENARLRAELDKARRGCARDQRSLHAQIEMAEHAGMEVLITTDGDDIKIMTRRKRDEALPWSLVE